MRKRDTWIRHKILSLSLSNDSKVAATWGSSCSYSDIRTGGAASTRCWSEAKSGGFCQSSPLHGGCQRVPIGVLMRSLLAGRKWCHHRHRCGRRWRWCHRALQDPEFLFLCRHDHCLLCASRSTHNCTYDEQILHVQHFHLARILAMVVPLWLILTLIAVSFFPSAVSRSLQVPSPPIFGAIGITEKKGL